MKRKISFSAIVNKLHANRLIPNGLTVLMLSVDLDLGSYGSRFEALLYSAAAARLAHPTL